MTNNEAEYEALIYDLELALKLGVQNLKVLLDSELVFGQMNRVFEVKDQRMKVYCDKLTRLVKCFQRINIQEMKRELNARVDKLAKCAAYGEYDKKNRLTTSNEYPAEVNMIEAGDELEPEVSKES